MNLEYELFQQKVDYKRLYYLPSLLNFSKEANNLCIEKFQDQEEYTACYFKYRSGFDFVFNTLTTQLEREDKVNNILTRRLKESNNPTLMAMHDI